MQPPEPEGAPGLPAGQPGPELLTQKEYARRRGWSKQYVNQLVRQGRIPIRDGRIDPIIADAALARDRDPARGRTFSTAPVAQPEPVGPPGQDPAARVQGSYAKARTLREHFRAMREKMDYEAAIGRLVEVAEVRDVAFEVGRRTRQEVASMAERIARALVAELKLDQAKALTIAREQARLALSALSENLAQGSLGFKEAISEGDPKGDTGAKSS